MKNLPKCEAYTTHDTRKITATPDEIKTAGKTDLMKKALLSTFKQAFDLSALKRPLMILIVAIPLGVVVYYFMTGAIKF